MLAGGAVGVARAWWDVGTFDAAAPLEAFAYPADDEPDYWQVPDGRRAKAAFDSLRFDFGKLEVGRTMRHVFRVTNEGDYPLVLAERESSCICTVAELEDRPILPGETAEITLEWNAPAKARPGEPYRQWTAIDTNDPQQASVTLVVEGHLTAPVAVETPTLAFGTVAKSQSRTLSTRVLSYHAAGTSDTNSGAAEGATSAEHGLSLVGMEFDDPTTAALFDVRTEPVAAEELGETGATAGLRLSVTPKPGLPEGPFLQTIRLRTNVATETPLAISLVGEVGPDAFVSGPGYSRRTNTLNLGRVDPTKGVERRLTLVVFAPADATVAPRIVETTPERLHADLGEPTTSSTDGSIRWPLVVRVSSPDVNDATATGVLADETQPVAGKIILATGHPAAARIEIVVQFSTAPVSDAPTKDAAATRGKP